MQPPFFILGNPRSGTTMFRLMINSHPEIAVTPECGFFVWLADGYMQQDFSELRVLERFLDDLLKVRKFDTWSIDINELKTYLLQLKLNTYRDICIAIYQFKVNNKTNLEQLVGDKNNFYLDYIDQIKLISPESKFVCIVRDGRDVACSYLDLMNREITSTYAPKLNTGMSAIAKEWKENNLKLNSLSEDERVIVRYEDLIQAPEQALTKVCQFLGKEYHPSMLEFYKQSNSDEPAEFLQWKEKTQEPVAKNNFNKFIKILTPQQIAEFELVAEDVLNAYGYETKENETSS
jgi:hypothetical protein